MEESITHSQPAIASAQGPHSESQPSESPSAHHPIQFVEEAQILLSYAAQQGLELDQAVVSVIVNARYELEENRWTAEREIEFWSAFDALSRLVAPVSIASLKATRAFGQTLMRDAKSSGVGSRAEYTSRFYQRWTLGVLAVLLIVQVYWLIGSVTLTAATQEIPAQIASIDAKIAAADERLNQARRDGNEQAARSILTESDDLRNARRDLGDSLYQYYYVSMKKWSSVLCLGIFCQSKTDANYAQMDYIEIRQTTQLILQPIQLYILPLLYGLLGASAYVLRNITHAIQRLTYTVENTAKYRLRIHLGALAGLAVGWFLFSPSGSSDSMLILSVKQLSPLAVSFLAGYSVELLFSAMDRLVSAFATDEIAEIK